MKKLLIISFLFIMNISYAEVLRPLQNGNYQLTKNEIIVAELLQDYARILGLNILFDGDTDKSIRILGKKEIAKEELDLFISTVAKESGLAILKREQTNLLEIITERDVVYRGGKLYKNVDEIKPDYRYYRFLIPLKFAQSNDIARNLRPLVSRYARIIDEKNANTLILVETGKNIHILHEFIQKLDTPEFQKDREKAQKLNQKAKVEIEDKIGFTEALKDQYFLFLFIFSLLGIMLGFTIRGYVIKKTQGWE